MKKYLLAILAVFIIAGSALASQVNKTIKEETELKPTLGMTATSDTIYLQDYKDKSIFVKYDETDVGGHSVAFEAANQDLTDPTYQYFGFVSSFGSWIVQRFKIGVSGTTIKYEYCAGTDRTDYDALWNTSGVYVGTLTFTTFDQIIL